MNPVTMPFRCRGMWRRITGAPEAVAQALRDLEGNAAAEPAPGGAKGALRSTAAGYARAAAPAPGIDPALAAPGEYETVLARAQLDAWVARIGAADEFAFDTETDSLDALCARLVGLSLRCPRRRRAGRTPRPGRGR